MNAPRITGGYWKDRLDTNAAAVFHQWEQLTASGCIENFRIAAGESEGFREGWFFSDSDAYKWLEAAARVSAAAPDPVLLEIMNSFIALIGRAQEEDGYLFTYNQIHFPGSRWVNLQIEHELYCHGHLIEAGVSFCESAGRQDLLRIVRKAADRIVEDFSGRGPAYTPGHEEIEIALIRLYRLTGHRPYLEMAKTFLENRGTDTGFSMTIIREFLSSGRRGRVIRRRRRQYLQAHPAGKSFHIPPGNRAAKPPGAFLRFAAEALAGSYFQQHLPLSRQKEPKGHAVRFAYLETAAAMLCRETGDTSLLPVLETVWERMVSKKMYVTGGLGSRPGTEGFGRDGELHPKYAYAETCAALGSMFWSQEMALMTGEARYSDLFEWQLYNASAVGMGCDGHSYFYNNPLSCRGGTERMPWYEIPCCPSNISRTWAALANFVCAEDRECVMVFQYIDCLWEGDLASVEIHSAFPRAGDVSISVTPKIPSSEFTLRVRIASWSRDCRVSCNGEPLHVPPAPETEAAGGFDPRESRILDIRRRWSPGDRVGMVLDMPVRLRRAASGVRGCSGRAAVSRGPLVYCLENCDNPEIDILAVRLDPESLEACPSDLFGGIKIIKARSLMGEPLVFIPYHLWGNRGPASMTVWIRE